MTTAKRNAIAAGFAARAMRQRAEIATTMLEKLAGKVSVTSAYAQADDDNWKEVSEEILRVWGGVGDAMTDLFDSYQHLSYESGQEQRPH